MSHRALFRHVPDPNRLVRCGVCHSDVQRHLTRKLPNGLRECRECQRRYAEPGPSTDRRGVRLVQPPKPGWRYG